MTRTLDIVLSGRRGTFDLDARLEVPAEGITAIFGRSGSGKTTLLRAIAGLETMNGRVTIDGTEWQNTPEGRRLAPERRRVGYVFQEAALLPHLTVRANLDYAAKRARTPRPAVGLADASRWLALDGLLDRSARDLSGGERQRVAIARALVASPVLLLMDEPLASLDLAARDAILGHLERLRDALGIPVLYVTHAVDEVARLADRVAWLDGGRVRAVSPPERLFARLDVSSALGEDAGAVLPARIARHDDVFHLTEFETVWGPVFVHRLPGAPGDTMRLRIRARDVSIALDRERHSSILNVLPARVAGLDTVAPGEVLVRLTCPTAPEHAVLARIMKKSVQDLSLRLGLDVYARVKGVSVR